MTRRKLATITTAVVAGLVLTAQSCHPHTNHPTLVCIRGNESATSGLYNAQNPRSSASGAYQFIDRTWRALLREMGRGGEYSRAIHAPPHYQDMVAYYALVDPGRWKHHWAGVNRRCY